MVVRHSYDVKMTYWPLGEVDYWYATKMSTEIHYWFFPNRALPHYLESPLEERVSRFPGLALGFEVLAAANVRWQDSSRAQRANRFLPATFCVRMRDYRTESQLVLS